MIGMAVIERGSGNVYEDLGLANASEMQAKAMLVAKIREVIKLRHLMQVEASELLGTSQSKLFRMLLGQFRCVSEAELRDCLKKLSRNESGLENGL
mgnify:CR=1 FL=1